MSIIFGIRKPPGDVVIREELLSLATATERYATDGMWVVAEGRTGMGFQPCHTHERSNFESQPVIDARGNILCLDGRLDNHSELRDLLGIRDIETPDSLIVLSAFHLWGTACFSRLIGDWALAIWSAAEQTIYIARDHAGTRTLFFQNSANFLSWSTHLETLLAGGSAHPLDEEYAACYLASQPIRDLTPYKNIRSVPPAHYLAINDERVTKQCHWDWMVKEKIRYRTDEEYEQHFLLLFRQSVQRRTGPGARILAQLSGGMDSTSIVCMSDHIRGVHDKDADLLDTLSYYDDSEPNWNERPYFSLVESRRGKTGIHIATSFLDGKFEFSDLSRDAYLIPGSDSSTLDRERQLQAQISGCGYRAILSGIGGDEVLGGIPVPSPELADYLVSGNLVQFLKKSLAWCFVDRTPLIGMFFLTTKFAASLYLGTCIDGAHLAPWISPRLREICTDVATSAAHDNRRFGFSPSAISNGLAWWTIMETLPHLKPSILARYEYRYPYLDRDLVDFLFRIPREQLVRPGRRRSLMRRALKNIVPNEILERRRKASLIRGPLAALRQSQSAVEALFANSLAIDRELIDGMKLRMGLAYTVAGADPKFWLGLNKAISFELWLRAVPGDFGDAAPDRRRYQALLH